MSTPGDVAAALALALGVAMPALPRPRWRLLLCAAQAVLAGIALLPSAPLAALLTAVLSGGATLLLATRIREPASASGWPPLAGSVAMSAVVLLALPPEFRTRIGPGAAMAAAGLLLAATSRTDGLITGLFAAQNGLALAAGRFPFPLEVQAAMAFPLLPGLVALVPLLEPSFRFRPRAAPLPRSLSPALEAAGYAAALLASGAILGATGRLGPWLAFLSALAAALTAWAEPAPDSRSALQRLARLAGILLALLADDLVLGWLGFVLALIAARADIRRAGNPAMLTLGGTLLLCLAVPAGASPAWTSLLAGPAAPDPRLIAFAAIPLLAGFLLPAASGAPADAAWSTLFLLALVRLLTAIDPTPIGVLAQHLVPLLALLGMLAFGVFSGARPGSRIAGAHAVQACAAAFALGLGGESGRIAGVSQLSLLILSLTAIRTAPDRPAAWAALAGLAGIPPFGLFAGLVLTGHAAARTPWVLLPFVAALTLNAWALFRKASLPPVRTSRTAPAWTAIGLALLLGLGTPAWIAGMALTP